MHKGIDFYACFDYIKGMGKVKVTFDTGETAIYNGVLPIDKLMEDPRLIVKIETVPEPEPQAAPLA